MGTRATHMVLEVYWAENLLTVLLLWLSRLTTIVSPREFSPTLTSYRTHHRTSNFPTDGANCGSRFLDQAYYNEFVESGFESWALIRWRLILRGKTYRIGRPKGPREKGTLARGLESLIPLASRGPLSFSWGPFSFLRPFSLWDLPCHISFSSIHLLPTLVGHPCLYLSARPIGHFFWGSMSCCSPHRAV